MGPHTLWVEADYRYKMLMVDFNLASSDTTISMTLEPHLGALHIVSVPESGDCFLDGEPVGQTPLMLPEVPYGRHVIVVRDESSQGSASLDLRYPEWEETVVLVPCQGWVRFLVDPVHAAVELAREDDPGSVETLKDFGHLAPFRAGRIRVTANAPGYEPYESSFAAGCGDTLDVPVVLAGKSRTKALASSLVPGGGWFYLEKPKAATWDIILVGSSLAVTATIWALRVKAEHDHEEALERYRQAISAEEIGEAWKEVGDTHKRVRRFNDLQSVSAAVTGLFYVQGILRVLLWHPPSPAPDGASGPGVTTAPEDSPMGKPALDVNRYGAVSVGWQWRF